MNFKKWLFEVGMGGGGVGSGVEPPKQNPTGFSGAFADYHSDESTDSKNPKGLLPIRKKKKK